MDSPERDGRGRAFLLGLTSTPVDNFCPYACGYVDKKWVIRGCVDNFSVRSRKSAVSTELSTLLITHIAVVRCLSYPLRPAVPGVFHYVGAVFPQLWITCG